MPLFHVFRKKLEALVIISLVAIVYSHQAFAESVAQGSSSASEMKSPRDLAPERVVLSHNTLPAQTLAPGKLAFRPAPGSDLTNSTFVMNVLSIGVLPGLELGTAPVLWTIPQQAFNLAAKVLLYNSDELQVSVGIGGILLDVEFPNSAQGPSDNSVSETSSAILSTYQASTLMNWRALGSKWAYGLNLNTDGYDFRSESGARSFQMISIPNVYGDVTYRYARRLGVTAGFSYSNLPVFGSVVINQAHTPGFGISHSYVPPKWVTKVAVGVHYYPVDGRANLLWSLSL